MKLKPDQLQEAIQEANTIFVWVDDLFGEMGAFLPVEKDAVTGVTQQMAERGWSINDDYSLVMKNGDLWIGG